jgi:hypothetical protein
MSSIYFLRGIQFVRFEVLTAVVMKSSIFWDITPYNPLKVNCRFGGSCRLYLHGRRISQARNQRESRWKVKLCSAETSIDLQRTTQRYIPEVRTLQVFSCQHEIIISISQILIKGWLCWDHTLVCALRSLRHCPVKCFLQSSCNCQGLPHTHRLMPKAFVNPRHLPFHIHFCKWMGVFMRTTFHVGQSSSVSTTRK